MLQIHHITPRHMGGDNSPANLTPPISVALHAALHEDLYIHFGKTEDFIAWKCLAGLSLKGSTWDQEFREKISKGKTGVKFSVEHKENLSKSRKGKKKTELTKQRMSLCKNGNTNAFGNNNRSIKWKIISPDNIEKEIFNLAKFCRENNLSPSHLGKRGFSQGYTCIRMENQNAK